MSVHGIGMTSQRARARMLENLKAQGISDPLVLAAINAIPRHPFLEESIQQRAYDDTPLPIGQGQTISSPYIVARSCELACRGHMLERVLEIGGGCGYQAAVLSRLAREVLSLERIAKLIGRARQTLRELRINNVLMKNVDGSFGYPAAAPFDAIVVQRPCPTFPMCSSNSSSLEDVSWPRWAPAKASVLSWWRRSPRAGSASKSWRR